MIVEFSYYEKPHHTRSYVVKEMGGVAQAEYIKNALVCFSRRSEVIQQEDEVHLTLKKEATPIFYGYAIILGTQ